MAEHLLSKYKALGSIPSTARKKKKDEHLVQKGSKVLSSPKSPSF
jgi:hypothetical protein